MNVQTKPSQLFELDGLTDEQAIAARSILNWNGNSPFYLLTGFAGTGKTYLIQRVVKTLLNQGVRCAFAAPTHRAVQVLRGMADAAGLDCEVHTIQSLLWLSVGYSGDGNEVLEPNWRKSEGPHLRDYDLVICDEASMVGNELWGYITAEVERSGTKILMVGDPAQLPPVNEAASPCFSAINDRSHLSIPQRYDGAIAEYATELRHDLERRSPLLWPTQSENGSGIWRIGDRVRWHEALVNACRSEEGAIALAWTNRRVQQLNAYVRGKLSESGAPDFTEGERLVAKKIVMDSTGYFTLLNVGESATVHGVPTVGAIAGMMDGGVLDSGDKPRTYKAWYLKVEGDRGGDTIAVLHRDSWNQFQADAAAVRSRIKDGKSMWNWREYGQELQRFNVAWQGNQLISRLSYQYAMTAHGAQGGTYENIFVDVSDIRRNRRIAERNQCLYVAATRAAKRLFILG